MQKKTHLLGINSQTLLSLFPQVPKYRIDQILDWIYKKLILNPNLMSNIPSDLKNSLTEKTTFEFPKIVESSITSDNTEKFLFELEDSNCIESVIIKSPDRVTFCLSSQVGCPIKCRFCASGMPEFIRNLSVAEILGQFINLSNHIKKLPDNLVFMGIGEGLLNFENLMKSLDIICSEKYIGYSQRRITISTSGLPTQIDRLADLDRQYNLAVSLHAPDDITRAKLIPDKTRFPISEIVRSCEHFFAKTGRMITIEYTLIENINDSLNHSEELAAISKKLRAKINLIPFNKVEGCEFSRPSREKCIAFSNHLQKFGALVTFRYEKGSGIDAACGQLRSRKLNLNNPTHK